MPWTEEPGGLLSMGSHRVGHDYSNLAAVAAAAAEANIEEVTLETQRKLGSKMVLSSHALTNPGAHLTSGLLVR